MSCPLELVLARAVERHVFRLGGSDLSFWMRNPFEGFKWQLVHRLDLRRNCLTGDPLASLTLRSHVRPLSSSSVVPAKGWSWPVGDQMRRQPTEPIKPLHLGLLGDLQRIVNLDSEVAHRALQLGMAEQQLHHSEILCSSVDQ
jgi:hypothetical protein